MSTTVSTTESTSTTSFTSLDQVTESNSEAFAEYFVTLSDDEQLDLVTECFQEYNSQLQAGQITQEEYDQKLEDLKTLIATCQEANNADIEAIDTATEDVELTAAQQAQYDGIKDGLETENTELDELLDTIDDQADIFSDTFIDATDGLAVTPTNIQAGYNYMINLGGTESNPLDDDDDEILLTEKQTVSLLSSNIDFELDPNNPYTITVDDGDTMVIVLHGLNGEEATITLEGVDSDYTALVVDMGSEDFFQAQTESQQKMTYWSGSDKSMFQDIEGVYANETFLDVIESLQTIATNYLGGATSAQIEAATQILELIYADPTAIDINEINEILTQYGISDKAMICALITEAIFIEDNANFSTVMATLGGTFVSLFEATTSDEMAAKFKTATLLIVGYSTGTSYTLTSLLPDETNPSATPEWTDLESTAEALEACYQMITAAGVANVFGDSAEAVEGAQDAGGYVDITDEMIDQMMEYYNTHNWQIEDKDGNHNDENVTRDDMELIFANYLNGLKNLTNIEDIRTYTTTFMMSTYIPNGYYNDDMAASILWTFYQCAPDIFTSLVDDATFSQMMWSWIDNDSRDPTHHDELEDLLF